MHKPLPMHQARRCRARSKRSGKPCQAPAVKGWAVCRMHGAGGGAPLGNKNALRHGLYTADAIAARRAIRALLRVGRELSQRI
jgi:glucans biosynthesis protein